MPEHEYAISSYPEQGMTHWKTWVRLLLWVALAGLAGAVVGGLCEAMLPAGASEFSRQQYFHYHLYATGFHALAGFVNRWLPYSLASALLLAAVYRICRTERGRQRPALVALFLPATACIAVYYPYQTKHWKIFIEALPHAPMQIWHFISSPLGLLIPLALLVWLLKRLRRRAADPSADLVHREKPKNRHHPAWNKIGTAAILVAKVLIVLPAAAFLVVNGMAQALTGSARHTVQKQHNIIFIMVDTLRADHIGCYGYDLPTTPNIDRFAGEATRFEQAVSQAPYTLWSVTSLMSSHYPETFFSNAIEDDSREADVTLPMLAEVLHDKGYATAAIVSNTLLSSSPLTAQGYDSYSDRLSNFKITSTAVTRAAIKRVSMLKGRKFFLSLVYMDPHQPYVHHPRFKFGDSAIDKPRREVAAAKYPRDFPQRRQEIQGYDSEIAFTDHHIGVFLDELKRQGLYDDACIVFFSDHGEEFLEHGSWGHRWTLYEEAVQVPLIIKFPRQDKGRIIGGAFPLIDLVPSLLAWQGYDIAPLKMHGDPLNLDKLLHCAEKPIFSATLEGMQSVRYSAAKYIRKFELDDLERKDAGEKIEVRVKQSQLYDLKADPLEQRDLMARKTANATLSTRLLEKHDQIPDTRKLAISTADDILHDRLDSLGYLDQGAPLKPDDK